MQISPAALPLGMFGMLPRIEGAMQQAPQSGRHFVFSIRKIIFLKYWFLYANCRALMCKIAALLF